MREYKRVLDNIFLLEHRMQKLIDTYPKFEVKKSVLKVFEEVVATASTLNAALSIIEEGIENAELKKSKNGRKQNKAK